MNRRRALKIVRKHLRPPYHRYPWRTWARVLGYMERRNLAYYDRQFWPLEAESAILKTSSPISQQHTASVPALPSPARFTSSARSSKVGTAPPRRLLPRLA